MTTAPNMLAPLAKLSPVTQTLLAVAGAHLAVNLILAFVLHQPTLFEQTSAFFQRYIYGLDSWMPMREAYWYLKQHGEGDPNVYQAIFFDQQTKFQYPLTSLLVYEPVALLSQDPGFPGKVLSLVSWGALLVTPLVLWRLMAASVRAYAPAFVTASKAEAALQLALIVVLTWTFYPLLKAYHLGQVQAWLNLGFGLMILCWIDRRDIAAGVLLAIACMFKPQLGVLLIWGAVRGRWRFVIAAGVCAAVGGAAALALYGFDDNIAYLNVLSYLSAHGETYYANQSVNGILNRWVTPDDSIAFHVHGFPAENPLVRFGSLIAAVIALAATIFARYRHPGRGDAIDLAAAGLLCTVASPIAWEHHYGVAAIGFALAFPAILACGVRWKQILFAASFVAVATYLPLMNKFAGGPLNILQSYLFFGAVGLAYLLVTLPAWGAAPEAPVKSAAPTEGLAAS